MRNYLVLSAAILALGAAAPAMAQSAGPVVNVAIGPALQQKVHDYGQTEVIDLSRDLQKQVQGAIDHSRSERPVQVNLVIEDAVPNRPTFDQLSRTVGLSLRSKGVGGARVSGVAIYADGTQRPIREQFFETDLREDIGVTTWSDAYRAFDQVSYDVGHGRFPAAYVGPGPSGSGHFGYPFNNQ